jgi:hypothetical protein
LAAADIFANKKSTHNSNDGELDNSKKRARSTLSNLSCSFVSEVYNSDGPLEALSRVAASMPGINSKSKKLESGNKDKKNEKGNSNSAVIERNVLLSESMERNVLVSEHIERKVVLTLEQQKQIEHLQKLQEDIIRIASSVSPSRYANLSKNLVNYNVICPGNENRQIAVAVPGTDRNDEENAGVAYSLVNSSAYEFDRQKNHSKMEMSPQKKICLQNDNSVVNDNSVNINVHHHHHNHVTASPIPSVIKNNNFDSIGLIDTKCMPTGALDNYSAAPHQPYNDNETIMTGRCNSVDVEDIEIQSILVPN